MEDHSIFVELQQEFDIATDMYDYHLKMTHSRVQAGHNQVEIVHVQNCQKIEDHSLQAKLKQGENKDM